MHNPQPSNCVHFNGDCTDEYDVVFGDEDDLDE